MLQWMGGSRRKVTTSRKSTHKRQKQYFEQRKRQHQHTAGLEGYADGKHSHTSHYENRSLDLLSLANVATAAEEHKTRNLDARDDSDEDDFSSNNQDAHHLPSNIISEGIHVDQSETNEEKTSLNHEFEVEYSKMVPAHIPDQCEALAGKDNKHFDSFKLPNTHPVSVIDLVGDGGVSSNAEENPTHAQESHVAFSIEGLGELEAKTPDHSPKINCRSFLHGFSPKMRAGKTSRSKHLEYDFDDFGLVVAELSSNKCLLQQPLCSRDVDIFDDPDQKFLQFREPSSFNWCETSLHGDVDNNELIYSIRGRGRNFRNGPNYLNKSVDHLGVVYDSFYENWMDPVGFGPFGYDDHYHCKELWKQDILDGWNVQKKRTETTRYFGERESPVTNPKHQIVENLPDVVISDTRCRKHQIIEDLSDVMVSDTRRRSTLGVGKDVKDSVSCFLTTDTRESLSLLSEESCSSTAVRGDSKKKT
ncbi:uncharacterized protein LOC127253884 isoform X2 [Andrographis paniculata]|uniref:uncharacterized protein LOC127253884 isoform X2 n=1 Tax=Andrographis paniculata TaxID=175694 RepID=UPI0021E8140D|nr:uncharacterized protein LOC127253884 isoform X2 [Andrographis paniculata]